MEEVEELARSDVTCDVVVWRQRAVVEEAGAGAGLRDGAKETWLPTSLRTSTPLHTTTTKAAGTHLPPPL